MVVKEMVMLKFSFAHHDSVEKLKITDSNHHICTYSEQSL
jgi:hypothetical protein